MVECDGEVAVVGSIVFNLSGPHIVVDASHVLKRLRKLFQKPDVCSRPALSKKLHHCIKLHKVKSQESLRPSFEDRIHWFGNQKADELADARARALCRPDWLGEISSNGSFNGRPGQSPFGFVRRLVSELSLVERPGKANETKPLQNVQDVSPTYSWKGEGDRVSCMWCLKRGDARRKFQLQSPCPGGRLDARQLSDLGVHRSHSVELSPKRVRCSRWRKTRLWMRLAVLQQGCPKEGRRRW